MNTNTNFALTCLSSLWHKAKQFHFHLASTLQRQQQKPTRAENRHRFNLAPLCAVADLNVQDNAGNTPLHVAVENESLEAVDYLLSA